MIETRRRIAMVVAMAMAFYYLTYRGLYTLNFSGIYAGAASLSLYLAEAYGCFLMFLYFFQIWEVKNPKPLPPLQGRTVDVFIPTYNEDPDLLRGTIGAALKIDYPHKTYVLDDGKRPEVKALCEELGAIYITRPSNIHAKAGNLNHALEMTDGEFLIIFDADHVAERHFIDRLIGYFADEKLGFIQTPHSFYNYDAYQGILNYEKGVYWEEGMLFYNVTQPGKNYWNGVSFCGSAAMFRRQALSEVNLVATESITEDMHTGMRMHSLGWNSLFVNERLITAQAAADVTSFNTQRLRWGEGNLGIIGFDNPITIKGLTFAQRLCYLGSMLSWTTGVQKLLIYIAPILMLLTGISPVTNLNWTLAIVTFVYMICVWIGVKVSSNGYGKLLAIELTQMACFWVQVQGTWRAIFNRKKASFVVTSKRGRQSNSILKHIAPQIAYILASVVALTWAYMKYFLYLSDDFVGLTVGTGLLGFHSWLAWVVIRRALRPGEQRYSWRHPAALHVSYKIDDEDGKTHAGVGITRDINERGLGLITFEELPATTSMDVTVTAGGRSVTCKAEIRWRKTLVQFKSRRDGMTQAYRYGLEFEDLDTQKLDALWWIGAQYAVARQYEKFKGGEFGIDLSEIPRLPKRKEEHSQQLPIMIGPLDRGEGTVTETIGLKTFTVMLKSPLEPETEVDFKMLTPFGPVQGGAIVEEAKTRRIAGVDLHETRLQFCRFFQESRGKMTSSLGHGDARELAPVMRLKPEIQPLPKRRPAAILSGVSATLACIVVLCAIFFQRDEIAIAAVNHKGDPSPEQVERLQRMVGRICESDSIDEAQVLRLRAAMRKLGREDNVRHLDFVLAQHATETLDGQILKAVSLQNLERFDEAEAIFVELIRQVDDLFDDKTRAEMILAAARNSANLGNYEEAKNRYAEFWSYDIHRAEGRGEYAGILSHLSQRRAAIKILEGEDLSRSDRHLLASIYSAEKEFQKAVKVYEQSLAEDPKDQTAQIGRADNYLWGKQYQEAVGCYRALLAESPGDLKFQEKLAHALFWNQDYQEAFPIYKALLGHRPDDTSTWDGFILSAAKIPRLDFDERQIVSSIYQRRDERPGDVEFLYSLLGALAHFEDIRISLALMEELLAQRPEDAQLRLRLADGLHEVGEYARAEENYKWLLERSPATPTLETTFSSKPRRAN